MSAAEALRAARPAGVGLSIDGEDLLLRAPSRPSSAIIDAIARYKEEILALLRPGRDGWSAEAWLAYFDERIRAAEGNGTASRGEAETQAFESCVVEWLSRTFEGSPQGRCWACGGGDDHSDVLTPFGIQSTGHVWLHSRCWPAWYAGRKAEAVAALRTMGIEPQTKLANDFRKNRNASYAATVHDTGRIEAWRANHLEYPARSPHRE